MLATLILSAANAQKPAVVVSDKTGWHKIGETTVDFKKEKDEVNFKVWILPCVIQEKGIFPVIPGTDGKKTIVILSLSEGSPARWAMYQIFANAKGIPRKLRMTETRDQCLRLSNQEIVTRKRPASPGVFINGNLRASLQRTPICRCSG